MVGAHDSASNCCRLARRRGVGRMVILLAGLVGLSGCMTVGPDYKPPHTATPAHWATPLQTGVTSAAADAELLAQW